MPSSPRPRPSRSRSSEYRRSRSPKRRRRLTLKTVFVGLRREFELLAPLYVRTRPAALDAYPTLPELLHRLTHGRERTDLAHRELVCLLVSIHQAAPHRLWVALLLRTFRPMLRHIFKKLVGSDREERLALLLTSFQEALRRVDPHRDPMRIGMYVRQATRKSVFAALRGRRDWEEVGFGEDAEGFSDTEGQARALAVEWLHDTPDGLLLCTSAEHGGLWAFVRRTYPTLTADEQAAVYHRLRYRRQQQLAELRSQLGCAPQGLRRSASTQEIR